MGKIIKFSLKNKFAVWLLTIFVIIAGLYSGFNMKLETIPDISTPVVTVSATYPGATPEQVADKISKPIEQKLQGLSGVDTVSSSSYQNMATIQVEYSFSKNMEKAEDEVRGALSSLELPDDVQEPNVSRQSISDFPIISLSVSDDEKSLEELTKYVKNTVVPQVEKVQGISSVSVSGEQVEEAELVFKQDKLKQLGLDEDTVKKLIQASDAKVPAGTYAMDGSQKSVVVDGKMTTEKDLENLEIPAVPSQAAAQGMSQQQTEGQNTSQRAAQQSPSGASILTVKLKEIADIKVTGKAESISRTNGKASIAVQVVKSTDANTVNVVNDIKEQMNSLEKKNKNLHVDNIFDQGKPIEDSVHTMLNKAIIGAIFAVIIILLFLRDIRSTIIAVISIPLSLLIAILALKSMDISLNIMTLGAMTVAIGRVVDDSIVVIENIYRRMAYKEEKLKGKDLIVAATKEMFVPIFSSTVVTVAVFLPLGLVEGPVGELFLPFALTVVFALLASLLVAVTLVPMLAHSLFKTSVKVKEEKPSKLAHGYKRILNWTLNHKLISFGLAVLLLVGSLFLVPSIGVSFLSSEQEKTLTLTYTPKAGQSQSDVEKAANRAEAYLMKRDGVKMVQYSFGEGNSFNPGSKNNVLTFVQYDEDTQNFDKEQDKVLRALNKKANQGEWGSMNTASSGSNNSLNVLIYGDSLAEIKPYADKVQRVLEKHKELKNVDSTLSDTFDEYTLVPNQKKAAELGLSASQIGMQISNLGQREVLTTIRKDGNEINVYLPKEKEDFSTFAELSSTKVTSQTGEEVTLNEVVDIKKGKTSNTVTRRDNKIYAEVSADIKSDDVGGVSSNVQKEVKKIDLPSDMDINFGGASEQINDSFSQLGIAMLAAIGIVYFVLVLTFGGGLAPFAILFSLPFTLIGALVALLISGETISISSMIGALMLIGIVVTNAIVLLDRVIHKEQEGLPTREALLEAGMTRLRPILMTALATIGALLPLAFGFEGGGLISKGLGVTVIGGLTSSTLLTLIIVPIVYEFFMKFKRKKVRE
ncbi:efflux RND transporter permease subunit [Priestia megaterium]|uniref:efflux RND transporter permease subunit n=1 Tax=Priestia megaterium TaxID=1404 RepID=UPI00298C01FE|nr:efflux RND transporter permease subunit [Priestia megaterium]